MTILSLMNISEEKWDDVISEVREYGIELAKKMGPVKKQRPPSDDEWDYQNAIDEQDWCLPTTKR